MLRLEPALCEALSCCAAHEEAGIPLQRPRKGGTGSPCRDLGHGSLLPRQNQVLDEHALLKCRGGAAGGGINRALTPETKSSQSVWCRVSALGSPPSPRELVRRSACPNRR